MANTELVYEQSNLYLENREKLRITGVSDVIGFDEQNISVQTQKGDLIIGGEDLKITKLDVESGEMFIEGTLNSFFYRGQTNTKQSMFGRLFR